MSDTYGPARRLAESNADHDVVPEQRSAAESGPARPFPLAMRADPDRLAAPAVSDQLAALTVGRADDPAEAAADRMAESALSRIRRLADPDAGSRPDASGPAVGSRIGLAGGRLDSGTSATIDASRGAPLTGPVRTRMEQAFGRDFGAVRIHDGADAARAAGAMSARAFTTGTNIFFAEGQFDPSTPAGEQVLAHELAHTIQAGQSAGTGAAAHRWPWSKKDPAKELEKEKAAREKKERKEQQKKESQEAKARAKQSKQNYQDEKTRLKGERDLGTTQRDQMREAISGDQAGGSKTSSTANDLNRRFEAALQAEKNLFDTLVESLGADAARDRAYQTVWLDTEDAQLRAVRPPRETAAERLTSDVRKMRTNANVRATAKEQAKQQRLDDEARGIAPQPQPQSDGSQRSGLDTALEGTEKAEPYTGIGEKMLGGVSTILGKVGKKETDRLQEGLKPKAEPTGGLEQKIPGPVGGFIKNVEDSVDRVKKGKYSDDDELVLPKSVETQAGEGISASTSILSDLFSTVQCLMRFAQAVKKAHSERSPRNIMAATKASADALAAMTKAATSTANLAKVIDPGVTSAVGAVIPGFNIFVSVMSMISNAMTMGTAATRVQDTDEALFAAHSKDGGGSGKPDVLVYPLLRVLQSYTKGLEQTVWDTFMAISDFVTGVATVATGGGYGIPVAVQGGMKVLDLLHSVGHFIADQVLTSITKKAQTDSLLALEGAAENQLEKDPAMAVDGIIFSAVRGDPIAERFVGNYEVKGKRITRADLDKLNGDPSNVGDETLFTDIRAAIMAAMGENVEPMYFYESWKKKIGSVLATAKKHTVDKWSATGTMATDRNEMDGSAPGEGKRGVGWRLKMMFKGPKAFERSQRKTRLNKAPLSPAPTGPVVTDNSTMGMDRMTFAQYLECECGHARLLVGATEQQRAVFAAIVEKQPDDALLAASQNPNNSPEWQEFFRQVLSDRALAKTGAGV